MPAVGDFLRRFRFHGVPGGPAPAGVPVDRSKAFEAELEPVFSFLEDAQRRAESLVEEANAESARRRAEGSEHVRQVLDRARSDAEVARAGSMDSRLARAEDQKRALLERAREEAERIDHVAAERMPAAVEELVRRVLVMGGHR